MFTLNNLQTTFKNTLADVKDLIDIGFESGFETLDDPENKPAGIPQGYIKRGIFTSILIDVGITYFSTVLNNKIYDTFVGKSPLICKVFFNKKYVAAANTLVYSQITVTAYNTFKVRYNTAKFKARRAERNL